MNEEKWKNEAHDSKHYWRFCPSDCMRNKTCFKGQSLPDDKTTCYVSPEDFKKKELYDSQFSMEEDEEVEELCDFTGEECIGDKRFCEECSVLTDEDEE